MIELFSGKNFTGDNKLVLHPGMKVKFSKMSKDMARQWVYKSMRVVPGTYIMISSSVRGNTDRSFSIGKNDVSDMYAFIPRHFFIYAHLPTHSKMREYQKNTIHVLVWCVVIGNLIIK